MIPPWSQACIYWKKSVIWRHDFQPSIFSMIVSLFHGSTLSDPYVKDTVFISQHFLQPSIITNCQWLIREKPFIWGKPSQLCSFKSACLFHRTSCSNFCLKSTVSSAQKPLQQSLFILTISQQQLQLFISHSKFFKEQLQTLALVRVPFRTVTFPRELVAHSEYL